MNKRLFKKSKPTPAKKQAIKSSKQLPKISRTIPEWQRPHLSGNMLLILICFLCGVILMGILLAEKELSKSYSNLSLTQQQYTTVSNDIYMWRNIVAKYPGYRDGYFHLAVLEYRIGDLAAAREYNQQALTLDPNFANGLAFAEELK